MTRASTNYARGSRKSGVVDRLIRAGHYLTGVVLASYELFLRLPVAIVLVVLWLLGAAILGLCLLTLYLCVTLLMQAL